MTTKGFPRTRGDRPTIWRAVHGSPAHAGNDPEQYETSCGFPRTRGDRPFQDDYYDALNAWFPRTRGDRPLIRLVPLRAVFGSPAHAGIDLFVADRRRFGEGGSPAHAGIDPAASSPRTCYSALWFPRTRGDRPSDRRTFGISAGGSPAHAGIDRLHIQGASLYRRAKRV